MSLKNSNDTIGNRTRDIPACSAVPQPAAPPRSFTDVRPVSTLLSWSSRKKKKDSRDPKKARPETETAVIISEGIVAERLSLLSSAEVKS